MILLILSFTYEKFFQFCNLWPLRLMTLPNFMEITHTKAISDLTPHHLFLSHKITAKGIRRVRKDDNLCPENRQGKQL